MTLLALLRLCVRFVLSQKGDCEADIAPDFGNWKLAQPGATVCREVDWGAPAGLALIWTRRPSSASMCAETSPLGFVKIVAPAVIQRAVADFDAVLPAAASGTLRSGDLIRDVPGKTVGLGRVLNAAASGKQQMIVFIEIVQNAHVQSGAIPSAYFVGSLMENLTP